MILPASPMPMMAQAVSGSGLLLDTYTGATEAYSLRKLITSATRAIRVRRSSDSTELDIGFIGEELDTATLMSFVGSSDGLVVVLYDQIGTVNYTSATTNIPRIVVGGVLQTVNGKPAIFPSTNGTGTNTASGFTNTATSTRAQPYSIFGVYKAAQATAYNRILTTGSIAIAQDGYTNFDIQAGTTLRMSASISQNVAHNFYAGFNGASSVNKNDGFTITGNAGTNTFSDGQSRILTDMYNSTSPVQSAFMEIIIYPNLQASNEAAIRANQKAYWGTP